MSNEDPWATPAEPETVLVAEHGPELPTKTAEQTEVSVDNHGVTVSFKGGPGYDAPMIAYRGNDAKDALAVLGGDPEGKNRGQIVQALYDLVAAQAKYFSGLFGGSGAKSEGGNTVPKAQPDRTGHPEGKKEFCSHGEMKYREDVSKAGNPYKGFFCTERDRDKQCKAIFLK